MRAHNNSRLPSFVLVGLIIALALVAYSYWSVSTKNSNLLTELDEKLIELRREKEKRQDLKKSLNTVDLKLKEFADNLDKEKGESNHHEKSWNNCKSELSNALLQVEQAKTELATFETKINEATDLINKLKEREEVQAAERNKCNTDLEDEKTAHETERQQASTTCERRLNDQRLLLLQHVKRVAGASIIVALQERGVDTTGVQLERPDVDSSRRDDVQPPSARSQNRQDEGVTQAMQQLQQTTENLNSRPKLAEIAFGHPDPMQGFQYQPLLRNNNNNVAPPSTTAAVNGDDSLDGNLKFPESNIRVQQLQRGVDFAFVKTSTTTAASTNVSSLADDADYDEDEDEKDEEVGGDAANAVLLPVSSTVSTPLPQQPEDEDDEEADERSQPAAGEDDVAGPVDPVKGNNGSVKDDGFVDPVNNDRDRVDPVKDDDSIDPADVKDAEPVKDDGSIDPARDPVNSDVGPVIPIKDDDRSNDIAAGRLKDDNPKVVDMQT